MLNAIKRTAQKNVMTVTSWYRIPEKVGIEGNRMKRREWTVLKC